MHPIRASLVTVLLLCIEAHSPADTGHKPRHTTDERGTEQQPLVIKTLPAPPTTEELKAEQEHAAERLEDRSERAAERAEDSADEERKFNLDVATLAVTLIVGAATVAILWIQARAFWKQTEQLKCSVEEMKTATKVAESAANSARDSAKAATLANEQSLAAYLGEQRPWIAIQGIRCCI